MVSGQLWASVSSYAWWKGHTGLPPRAVTSSDSKHTHTWLLQILRCCVPRRIALLLSSHLLGNLHYSVTLILVFNPPPSVIPWKNLILVIYIPRIDWLFSNWSSARRLHFMSFIPNCGMKDFSLVKRIWDFSKKVWAWGKGGGAWNHISQILLLKVCSDLALSSALCFAGNGGRSSQRDCPTKRSLPS